MASFSVCLLVHIKIHLDLWKSVLYPAPYWIFIVSRSIVAELSDLFWIINVITSAHRDNLISFPIFTSLISFYSFITPASASSTMMLRNSDNEQPYFFADFRRISSHFSPLKMMLDLGLSCVVLKIFRYIHSNLTFFRIFIIKAYPFCQKIFCIDWHDCVILDLIPFVLLITFIDFCTPNHPWISCGYEIMFVCI